MSLSYINTDFLFYVLCFLLYILTHFITLTFISQQNNLNYNFIPLLTIIKAFPIIIIK